MNNNTIDKKSFQLGMINCFIEMVGCGVKKLALSPPLLPEDYAEISELSERLVREFGIKSRQEKSLLVTSLQSPEFTKGKWSILYYKDDAVLEAYQTLKVRNKRLQESNGHDPIEAIKISEEFMQLLSYSRDVIAEKLEGRGHDPFMLVND